MGDLDKPNWFLSKGTKLPILACPSNPDSARFGEVRANRVLMHTPCALSKALASRQEEQLAQSGPQLRRKALQPAKATLTATLGADASLRLLYSAVTLGKKLAWAWHIARWSSSWNPAGPVYKGHTDGAGYVGLLVHQRISEFQAALSYNPRREAIRSPYSSPPPWASASSFTSRGSRNLLASILLFTTHSAILRILSHCVQSKKVHSSIQHQLVPILHLVLCLVMGLLRRRCPALKGLTSWWGRDGRKVRDCCDQDED